jgi:hypothetical protein
MAFSYCPHCGFKNMYSLQAPKFCGGCGEGLSLLSASKQIKTATSVPTTQSKNKRKALRRAPIELEDDPDGLDIYEIPDITKLSYSIQIDKNKFNLKDIIPIEDLENFKEESKKKKSRGRPRKK